MFPDTPQELLYKIAELAQGNDAAEWLAFVELYTPPLAQFVRLQNESLSDNDVDDIVQDVFIRLVAVLREGKIDRSKAKFRAYLASMTRRILIDRYRAAQVRPELIPETDLAASATSPAQLQPGTEQTAVGLVSSKRSSVSGNGLETIDPGVMVDIRWRMAVRESAKNHIFTKTALSAQSRKIYEQLASGLTPREVAKQMGVSYDVVKQVKSRIDRAIAAIEHKFL